MQYADIAIAAPTMHSFTYEVPEDLLPDLCPGMRVTVPFRRRNVVGYLLGLSERPPDSLKGKELREIGSILDPSPVFSSNMLKWLRWIAGYYCAPPGEVCRAALPSRLNRTDTPKTSRPTLPREMEYLKESKKIRLTKTQDDSLQMMLAELREKKPKPILLHGITGSGKTEIYLHLFEELVDEGSGGIMLVPEIGLTPQLTARFVERFGDNVALYHSGLTDAQRHFQWERVHRGEVKVVVGTRSALFAPLHNIRAIVVDEEHDPSYKQDEGVLYHARDCAIMRGHFENALVVLGSATPSMESYANGLTGKYHYIHLPDRTGGGVLPGVELVDMRNEMARQSAADGAKKGYERSAISPALSRAIGETLERNEQAMIFLNRRGFAHFLICEECGYTFECPNCEITLAYHRSPPKLLCHYCDYSILPPVQCPGCRGVDIVPMGRGTERIEAELAKLFPHANIARLDRDILSKGSARTSIFKKMNSGEIDILVGTQMIAKGHDFPNITLVGIVSADVALHLPDFRSAERTFQLITQMSGRAGRSEKGGRVILQTYQPDHISLIHARLHDYQSFFEQEKIHRESLGYPPYSRLANIRISSTDKKKVEVLAAQVAKTLKSVRTRLNLEKSIMLLGPAPAPMERLRNRFRWQLLIKARSAKMMGKFISSAHALLLPLEKKGLRISIDIDPINMM